MPRSSRPSLTRIAADLNVSAKTVSNAFSRPDQLSADLRQRILTHAAELGYAGPDPLARAFRRGSTGVIGVVYGNPLSHAFADQAFVRFLAGLATVPETSNHSMLLLPGSSAVANAAIDGAVVYSIAQNDTAMADLTSRSLPLVTVDQPRMNGVPWIGIDDRAAARSVALHLKETGHERIGIVSFALTPDATPRAFSLGDQADGVLRVTADRLAGFADVFAAETPVVQTYGSSEDVAEFAAAEILAARPDVTALACFGDRMALGAWRAATTAGRRVAEDLALTGFDDVLAPEAGVTSVSQPHAEKGRLAGVVLMRLLANKVPLMEQTLAAKLVIRTSSQR